MRSTSCLEEIASRACAAVLLALFTPPALAANAAELDDWIKPIVEGQVSLDVRGRYEYADLRRGPRPSNAVTLRTRLGYGSKPWEGLSGYVEVENVAAAGHHNYFDGTAPANRKSIVADPPVTEVNQLFVQLQREDLGDTRAIVGRQRISLDDARFIGDVGWRQNNQTYDAGRLETALGVAGLSLQYAYLLQVHRVFGNQGGAATRDFDSNSHLARVAYDVAPWLQAVAFAYFLDLRDAPTSSTDTYGLRATGTLELADDWSLGYQGSYAFQVDGGTSGGDNPNDYRAHYVLADVALSNSALGAVGAGYERLGSHHGRAVFTTPLATAHKFNGWADAFLDNGGPNGLQDLYAHVAPKLPWKLDAMLVYHHFFSDDGSHDLGHELDAALSRPFGKYWTLLTKVAWYDGRGPRTSSPADRIRFWAQATFAF